MSSSRKIFLFKNALAYDALLTSSRGHSCKLMKCSSYTSMVLNVKRCLPILSARIHATNFVQFSSTSEKPILGALLQESPYQLMKRIKDVELIPSFSDSNPNLLSEQRWVQDFLKNEITEEELIERTKNLEKKNNHRRDQSTKFTDSEVIKSTERWIKDFIIAMGLCPYASGGFEKKRSIHASQTTGLFIASEWIDLHAQHLVVEKEMVTKLLVFHNRTNYDNFKDMCDILGKSPVMNNLIENQIIKMAIFHPKSLNSLYMEGDRWSVEKKFIALTETLILILTEFFFFASINVKLFVHENKSFMYFTLTANYLSIFYIARFRYWLSLCLILFTVSQ